MTHTQKLFTCRYPEDFSFYRLSVQRGVSVQLWLLLRSSVLPFFLRYDGSYIQLLNQIIFLKIISLSQFSISFPGSRYLQRTLIFQVSSDAFTISVTEANEGLPGPFAHQIPVCSLQKRFDDTFPFRSIDILSLKGPSLRFIDSFLPFLLSINTTSRLNRI